MGAVMDYYQWRESEMERLRLQLFKEEALRSLDRFSEAINQKWSDTWSKFEIALAKGERNETEGSMGDFKP